MTAPFERPEKLSEVVVREPVDPSRPGWAARVRSADHKAVGILMIGFALVNVMIAGFMELLCQIQVSIADNTFLSPERYYSLHTLSDTGWLYLVALPLLAGLATYIVPLQIGARSSAFPRLSMLGFWMMLFGGALLYFSTFVDTWLGTQRMSAPLFEDFFSPGAGADFWLASVALVGGGLSFNAIDLVVTVRNMRTPEMTDERLPAFAHSATVYGWGILATAPVLVATCLMALVERQWADFGIFNPVDGGSPMLWKTLFTWWSHAAPLLAIVLAIGGVTEILSASAGRAVANARAFKKSLCWFAGIGVLGFGTVYFGTPVKSIWESVFMVIGLALLVPAFVILQSWYLTLRRSRLRRNTPFAFAIIFIGFFIAFLVFQTALALPGLSEWINSSQAGWVAWMNAVFLAGGFGGMAALVHWFPKLTGRDVSAPKMRLGIGMLAAGNILQMLMLFSMGMDGLAREVSSFGDEFQLRGILALVGMIIASLGMIGLLLEFMRASTKGLPSGNDPWHAGTLEWFAPSPPPINNFDAIPAIASETPLTDLREEIAAESGEFAGSVAQSPTAGRPSLRESKH